MNLHHILTNVLPRFFGTDPKKLVRRNGTDTSKGAAKSVDTTKMECIVYDAIRGFGDSGCISDEVRSVHPAMPYSSITARYRALLDKGFIVDTGERRRGISGRPQRVMRVSSFT